MAHRGGPSPARKHKPAKKHAGRGGPPARPTHKSGGHDRNHTFAKPGGVRHVRIDKTAVAAPDAAPRYPAQLLEQALAEQSPSTLVPGQWLWTMREGAERDLIEELLMAAPDGSSRPRRLGGALVMSAKPPPEREGRLDVTFARQGFRISQVAHTEDAAELASLLGPAFAAAVQSSENFALHVFVPDSTRGNELAGRAQALRDRLLASLPNATPIDDAQLRRHGGTIIQICVCDARTAALGCSSSDAALSLWPGGRARMRLGGDFPSRAARKLAEAFAWLGLSPGSGEVCVDLGAAPGGWSWLLLEKKARVIAVDPARMDTALMQNPRLKHVQGNAFDYEPEETVDWLFCDMAYRPLEVAQMLGRWARHRHTRLLVANFKLPMKRKVDMVERLRGLLSQQGFTGIRTRQLYHDREEITLSAHVR
jgi:23S rRNA (cytidine2498-2'-O)-methyltransferase